MKRTLLIEIDADEKTCSLSPGHRCPWICNPDNRVRYVCSLFGNRFLLERDGQLFRLRICRESEEKHNAG